ncbi:ncs1 nucleoside transporter family protein [Teratosphaeria destructans]|uniref:Ncs1 nucleoside transporter family protein n=1 Tax=Teratosphaeria destructans TaxID=418781 RepID=A0A9W7SW44_9PEZI|nr:ncs1 nucleoside transporter family protein [Teratosphaeria destructans]
MSPPLPIMASTTTTRYLRWLEVPRDENAWYQTDRWTNRDLIPMPKERRTYKVWTYCVYWCISGMCISAYILGSSLLAYGLNCQQALGAIAIGSILVSPLVIACGWMGERHHIGFTVASRFTFGMYGSYFPVLIRLFTTCFWDGLQAYYGGQATAVMLGAVFPSLWRMKQTLAGGTLLTKDLVGMLVFYVFFITIMAVPPEKLQKPFIASSIMFIGTLIGLLAWGVSNSGGGAGPLFETKSEPIHGSAGWAMLFGVAGVLGSWGGGTLGQSDWTRYANRPLTPMIAQTIIAPFAIFVCGTVGIIVTSCGQGILGETLWEPFQLLSAIQGHYNNSPRARAGLGIDIVLNSVSAGMDLAGLWPRYLNIRRGAYILACAGFAVNPWQYLSNASVFLTVISGFGIFLAPFTGVMLTEYLIVRKCRLVLADLYKGDKSSLYWYTYGFNWRAFASWALGTAVLMPGYVMSLIDEAAYNGWVKLFHLNFLAGVPLTMSLHWLICRVAPPPGLGLGTTSHDDDDDMTSERCEGGEDDGVEAVREEVKRG